MANALLTDTGKFMAKNLFSEDLAFSVAKFSSFEKGNEYFEDGLVEKIWKENDVYKALVRGNELYQVSLSFENEKLEYDCTCPYDFDGACKHVIAAILAFASDKKFTAPASDDSRIKDEEIKNLILQSSPGDLKAFLGKILKKEPESIEDLKIFLAGPKETPVTVSDYRERFIEDLNKIDLREALEMWYREGDDYYDTDSGYGDFAVGDSLDETVSGFMAEGQKYEENNNLAETLKIYQAIHEALDEKQGELKGDLTDLSDAFDKSKEETVECYLSALAKTENQSLKNIGIKYLGSLFLKESIHEEQIMTGLKNTINETQEAENFLSILSNLKKNNLSPAASSLLAFLYQKTGKWQQFEDLSLQNLKKNPGLILDLIDYYKRTGRKEDIIKTANEVLNLLTKRDDNYYFYPSTFISFKDLEIRIRYFLKDIYSVKAEYSHFIDNQEWIFLLTGSLKEYQELIKAYKEAEEKVNFWQKMKMYFERKHDVKNIFKIFKFEDKKEEILSLVKAHPNAECFPEMISFLQKEFARICFDEYKKKIDSILKETDVRKYQEAVYHLTRMKKIGSENEFADYIKSIKTDYWRRRRLLEELKEHKL